MATKAPHDERVALFDSLTLMLVIWPTASRPASGSKVNFEPQRVCSGCRRNSASTLPLQKQLLWRHQLIQAAASGVAAEPSVFICKLLFDTTPTCALLCLLLGLYAIAALVLLALLHQHHVHCMQPL